MSFLTVLKSNRAARELPLKLNAQQALQFSSGFTLVPAARVSARCVGSSPFAGRSLTESRESARLILASSCIRPCSGAGRRRRAAAEQRRIELQQWGQLEELLCAEEQADGVSTPSEVASARSYEGPRQPGSRRQQRRASRRAQAAAASALEDYFDFEYSRSARSLADSSSSGWGPHSAPLPISAEQEELELALGECRVFSFLTRHFLLALLAANVIPGAYTNWHA